MGTSRRPTAELNEAVRAIDPTAEVFDGYGKAVWIKRKGNGAAALRVLADGSDLATGPLRKMGWTDEQRKAIANAVIIWRGGNPYLE